MANARFEFFDDEQDAIMELLLLAEDLLEVKKSKITPKNPVSGKIHLYFETEDHKRRTNSRDPH